jgi:hypothetical protein
MRTIQHVHSGFLPVSLVWPALWGEGRGVRSVNATDIIRALDRMKRSIIRSDSFFQISATYADFRFRISGYLLG